MAVQKKTLLPGSLEPLILVVRNQRMILDADSARLYGLTTKATTTEYKHVRSHIAISRPESPESAEGHLNRSQIVTGSQNHRDPRLLPWAFMEHSAVMAANILRSEQVIQMSVFVVRYSYAFEGRLPRRGAFCSGSELMAIWL